MQSILVTITLKLFRAFKKYSLQKTVIYVIKTGISAEGRAEWIDRW